MNDTAHHLLFDPALAGDGAWRPAAALAALGREIYEATGRPVTVAPGEKSGVPGWSAFLPGSDPPQAAVTIGADYWPAHADVVLSHELLHLALKIRGYPCYVWADAEAGYLGIPLHSAFEHILVLAEQRRIGIDPDPLLARDIAHHARILLPVRRKTDAVAPECLQKAAIMVADRMFWGCDRPQVRKAAKVIDESRAALIFLDLLHALARFAAAPSPEALAGGMAACMESLAIAGRGEAVRL